MAPSKARTLANRKNAKRSTGPKTQPGKARSRANALKHGMTGQGLCLPLEDQREIQARFDNLADELCPQTAKELFYTRRAAMLTLRVDRCYLQEAHNLRMAVRDAVANHDKQIFDEVRLLMVHLHENPWHGVERLKQSPQGIDILVGQWRELRDALAQSGNLNQIEMVRVEQLIGRRYDATGFSRPEELNRMCSCGFDRFDYEGKTSADQMDACMANAKRELAAYFSRQIEDLLMHRATLPLAAIELNRLEAPMRAVIDVSNAGQLLRRYESAAAREVHKIFDYFDETEAAEAEANLDATPDPMEASARLASFGSPPEPGSSETVTEPEFVVEPVTDSPIWPVGPGFESPEPLVLTIEGRLRE